MLKVKCEAYQGVHEGRRLIMNFPSKIPGKRVSRRGAAPQRFFFKRREHGERKARKDFLKYFSTNYTDYICLQQSDHELSIFTRSPQRPGRPALPGTDEIEFHKSFTRNGRHYPGIRRIHYLLVNADHLQIQIELRKVG